MSQVGIFGNMQMAYGVNPTFNRVTLLNTGRNTKVYWNFEDFLGVPPIGSYIGNWGVYYNGAGAAVAQWPGDSAHPGIAQCHTGTTNTGYGSVLNGMLFATSPFAFGAGVYTIEANIALNDLSAVAEEYIVRAGWNDAYGAGTDGVYFLYDRLTSVNWQSVTIANGVSTIEDTGIPVAAATWMTLKIVVNENASSVGFYYNDVLVQTHTTNIPSGGGRDTNGNFHIIKSAGVTPRSLLIDWIWTHYNLSVAR
jgi:hypothetical protein